MSHFMVQSTDVRLFLSFFFSALHMLVKPGPQQKQMSRTYIARFERTILRQIFDPRRNHNTGEYERRKNEEIISMSEDSDIIATMKSKRTSWAGHIW